MKRIGFCIIFIFVISLISFGFKGLPLPRWVASSGAETDYPPERYIIGYAKSPKRGSIEKKKEIAESKAKMIVVDKFMKRVDDTLLRRWLSSEGIDDKRFEEKFSPDLLSVILELLKKDFEGIDIASAFCDRKKRIYHSLAILNRERESFRLKKMISRLNFEAERFYKKALKQEEAKDYFYALKTYFQSEEKKFEVLKWGIKYLAIRTSKEEALGLPDQKFKLAEVEGRVKKLIDDLSLDYKSEKEIILLNPEEPKFLEAKVVKEKDVLDFPVEGARLKWSFEEGDGSFKGNGYTSNDGSCKMQVENVKPGVEGFAKIKVGFDVSRLVLYYHSPITKYWLDQLEKKSIVFTIVPKKNKL